eukprot:Protomagalhaensia_sp_Gyna_25__2259@NODE_2234_length_1203_cov_8_012887_g1852_i0_p1_GENE_NODE_2234_length_1203_cov_8_012887_g1852_i0NODE_2234_length_1203_cov_8_012887_g1852_i0_p1_ORF_typecomplete_len228_score44_71DJ1_PfpI/PF01965_24/7_4e29ThiJ_like/PF17124_5/9_8e17_NODE_2234_length_1203_cov_8_012887_g1852_i054737
MKVLMVVTNVPQLGEHAKPTGLWLSEATHFHKVMKDAGIDVDYVSPVGGYVPLDPTSMLTGSEDSVSWQFYGRHEYRQRYLAESLKPEDIKPDEYKAIYYAGGHGTIWDFPECTRIASIAHTIYSNGGVVAAVCHGVVGLPSIHPEFLKDRKVTGFSNAEETVFNVAGLVPFRAEDRLTKAGAQYSKSYLPYTPHVVVDGRLVTGQNPQSTEGVAQEVLKLIKPASD